MPCGDEFAHAKPLVSKTPQRITGQLGAASQGSRGASVIGRNPVGLERGFRAHGAGRSKYPMAYFYTGPWTYSGRVSEQVCIFETKTGCVIKVF